MAILFTPMYMWMYSQNSLSSLWHGNVLPLSCWKCFKILVHVDMIVSHNRVRLVFTRLNMCLVIYTTTTSLNCWWNAYWVHAIEAQFWPEHPHIAGGIKINRHWQHFSNLQLSRSWSFFCDLCFQGVLSLTGCFVFCMTLETVV